MKTIKLETMPGDNIQNVAETAKIKSLPGNKILEFDFNGILCRVSVRTNVDCLLRDYGNAFLMGWKTIGDMCLAEYPKELQAQIKEKEKEQDEKQRLQQVRYNKKVAEEKRDFQKLIKGIQFRVKDDKMYNDWKDNNKDGYGGVVFEYAENWGKMLQSKIGTTQISVLVEDFDLQPNYLGITGFQHAAAKQILKQCWEFGSDIY